MKRRKFLQTSLAASLPVVLNGMGLRVLTRRSLFSLINPDSDRVLVLIQLNGGNDGLNTVIPLDYYDQLANARPNLLLPQSSLLPLDDLRALHPAMSGLKALYDDAALTVVQSVGYPNQNRSHFRSTDIWTSGSASDQVVTTGWLGRWFQQDHPDFPDDYPNAEFPDPLAITMGSTVSATCQGTVANFSMAIADPTTVGGLFEGFDDEVPDTPYGQELAFLRQSIAQTNAYADTIVNAANLGANTVDYPEDNPLARQLRNVALLISGGLRTKVYIVNIGGFDTHANQVEPDDPTQGVHAQLLQNLSDAIKYFYDDLKNQGLDSRVVGMTFSEFGRRIRANDSAGTDHGDAAPLLVFGTCLHPGFLGDNPEIPDQVEVSEGVAMQYDFRNVYGSILMDWFELAEEDVKALLFDDFQYVPILNPCATTPTREPAPTSLHARAWPNPFQQTTTIEFTSGHERVRLSIYNNMGQLLEVLCDRTLPAGTHRIQWDAGRYPAGNYYFHLQLAHGRVKTRPMTKVW